MRRLALLTAALALARPSSGASAPVGPRAVWNPSPAVLARFRDDCLLRASTDVPSCLLGFMEGSGAGPEAVAFARGLGGEGYLRRVGAGTPVAVGEAEYPFRANDNSGFLLLGGVPPIVDPADAALLRPLLDDERLAAIRRASPGASLWPGDAAAPAVEARPGGGPRFVFAVPVRVCHACADLARARVAFDFDGDGRFLGARLLTVEAPPLFTVAGEAERGKPFAAPIDGLRVFRLRPFSEGWTVEVRDKDGNDYCSVVTPPYRGTNALMIFGGDFKDAAGGGARRFRCVDSRADQRAASEALEKVLWSEKTPWKEVDAAAREHARLVAGAQRAVLTISHVRLGGPPGGRPWIESMRFRFDLYPPDEAAAP
ncbi:MAG TPA: hypothetical protein VH309_01040 [Elusimicrobiota bacterium]|nr:hypothetical protein [Elusimicrobiota bacterium]